MGASASTQGLPGFFILGAQKAATTSLDSWLRAQPGLDLPDLKETHFLSEDERYAKGREWYVGRFRGSARALRGEVDPDYLSDARVPERMARLYAGTGEAPKLVTILREPVGRAYSQWSMSRRRGLEERPFDVALEAAWRAHADGAVLDGHQDYYARGRYAQHLARFRTALPGSETLTMLFEHVIGAETRVESFRRLCEFVGLRGEPTAPDFDAVKNPAGRSRSRLMNRLLFQRGAFRRVLGRLVPSQDMRLRLGVLLERANTKSASGTPDAVVPRLPTNVVFAMREDVRELEAALGLDLSAWSANLDGRGKGEAG